MPKKSYTEQQAISYVFLLHYRYDDNMLAMQSEMEIDVRTLKKWRGQYIQTVLTLIQAPTIEQIISTEPPTVQELYDKFLLLLSGTTRAQDASYYSQVIHKLSDLINSGKGGEKEKEGIWDKLNKKLSTNEKAEDTV